MRPSTQPARQSHIGSLVWAPNPNRATSSTTNATNHSAMPPITSGSVSVQRWGSGGGGGRAVVGLSGTSAGYRDGRHRAGTYFVRYAKYVTESSAEERTLASRLRLAVVRLNRRLRAQRTDSVVSLTQIAAMSTLWKCGPLTPGELAAKEGVQPPSMTRVIAALEEHGFVSRRPHPTDGRQAIVSLTEEGVAFHDAQVQAREQWLDRRLAELDAEDRELLARAAEIIDRMAGQ